jgi:hypothetical protein
VDFDGKPEAFRTGGGKAANQLIADALTPADNLRTPKDVETLY